MNPIQSNNSQNTSARAIDLYARAAATLYGIISFNDFVKILEVYYGEGILSRDRIMTYFLASDNDDPIYYIHDGSYMPLSFPTRLPAPCWKSNNPPLCHLRGVTRFCRSRNF